MYKNFYMENLKFGEYYPGEILSLKKGNITVYRDDCMDAGGDWEKSIDNLLNQGWEIGETKLVIKKEV